MKKIGVLVIISLITLHAYAQKANFPKWNKFSEYEKNLTTYKKDTSAHAVVLNEVGYAYVESGGNFDIIIEKYVRIKILDAEGFDYATRKIKYHNKQKISKLKGSTTNFVNEKAVTSKLNKSEFFVEKISEDFNSIIFTLPDIKKGSIIEYSYTERTPFHYTFADGWIFQSSIPKIKSSYYAKIPGFWHYNISTIGINNPSFQQNKLINNCISINSAQAQCMFLELSLNEIPAYIEEDFTSSRYNFLKQIKFELKTITQPDGTVIHYNKTWKDSDKRLFRDYQFGQEFNKTKYISKQIPEVLLAIPNKIDRAKKIYSFIQNHFNWNEEIEIFREFNTKKAFENNVGNAVEINLTLINALNAAHIKTDLALLSTRQNGFPTLLYPVLTDFNYLVAHFKLDGVDYFLDATQKNLPFGMLPFKCLNGNIRVYDKINGSYWHNYLPTDKNEEIVYALGNINDDASIKIQARIISNGYTALKKRKNIRELSVEKYEEEIDEINEDLNVTGFNVDNLDQIDQPLIETFNFELESDFINNSTIYLNPFVAKKYDTNPFTLKERTYPIDLGYTRKYQYNLTFNIPEGYQIKSIPKNRKIILPENGGELTYLTEKTHSKINLNLIFSLNKTRYRPALYDTLKEMFAQLIIAQNEMIILVKE